MLVITGMTCGSCAPAVQRVLSRVSGVKSTIVDFELRIAIVTGSAAPPKLIAAVEAAGYGASVADAIEAVESGASVEDQSAIVRREQ